MSREVARAAAAMGVWLAAATATGAPTNYDLVRTAAHGACSQLVERLNGQRTERLAGLRAVGSAPGNFLVENTFSSALTEGGWQVQTRPDSLSGLALEFEVVDLGLEYPRAYRNAWLGEKRVVREARARVFARLVDAGKASVLWADQAEARQSDEVPADDLPALEEKNPADYAKATMPEARWNKIVEPVVVTGIIAGLIILFFSNQESN